MSQTRTRKKQIVYLRQALTFGALSLGVSMIPFTQVFALDDNALPSGGNVVGGQASFDYSTPNRLDIHQGTDRAVIHWDSFNIGANASTQFHQPNSGSVVVNRVTGSQDPTQILGSLRANGTVFVLDSNGVIFGANSRVDVGSIVVGAGTIDEGSFMGGSDLITIDNINANASIINNGTITAAEAGLAGFVAPNVTNNGVIQARLGTVALAAGTKATVDLYGDKLVEVATDVPLAAGSINNNGLISAEGGTVLMTANVAKTIVDSIINVSGIVDVSSAVQKGGKIILEGANTIVSGTLNASGKTGGGKIKIGGDYQGGGTIKHSDYTYITGSAVLKASTTGMDGDGGTIIVWADNSTQFDGIIEAKGGNFSGNGGLVETSGKKNLGISGWVDASAPHGAAGEWLLDPSNVIIDDGGGINIPGAGGTINAATDSYTINDASIEAALNSGNNVTITTVNGAGTQDGNIITSGAVSINKTSGASATLTLKAAKDITMGGTTITSSGAGGLLNIILNADSDGDSIGKIDMNNVTINTNNGEFFAGGGLDDGHDITDGFGSVAYNGAAADGRPDYYATADSGTGLRINNSTITTGTGNVTLLGQGGTAAIDGQVGTDVYYTTIDTTSGNILVIGQGGNAAANANQHGIDIGGDSILRSTTGSITVNGTGGVGNWNSSGVYAGSAFTLESNSGAINLLGAAGTSPGANYGMYTQHTNLISTGNSTITVKGKRDGTGGGAEDINLDVDGTVGGASATGNINYIADSFSAIVDTQTTGTVTFTPRTASTTIGVGNGASGDLNLNQSDLNHITASKVVIGDAALGTGDLRVKVLDLSAKSYNIEMYGNDIDLDDVVTLGVSNILLRARANAGVTGTIDANNATFTKTAGADSTITFKADKDVFIQGGGGSLSSSSNKLNTIIWSDADNTNGGKVEFTGTSFNTNGGYFFVGGGLDDGHDITDGFGDVAYNGTALDGRPDYYATADDQRGVYLNGTSINTGAGNITMMGQGGTTAVDGQVGLEISGGTIETSSGNILLLGHGGNSPGNDNHWGMAMGSNTVRSTSTGNITVNATGGTGNWNSSGFYTGSAFTIETHDGALNLFAAGGTAAGANYGMYTQNTNLVSTGTSVITVKGKRNGSAGSARDIDLDVAGSIGGGSATGNINFIADTFNLAYDTQTTGTVLVKPRTASTTIGLGGGPGDLSLSTTTLSHLIGSKVIIGDSAAGTGDVVLWDWDLSGKNYNVELYGNDIALAGNLTLGAGSFLARARDNGATANIQLNGATITKTAGGDATLLLKSDRDITTFNTNSIVASTGKLHTVLWANADNAGSDGRVDLIDTTITTNNGDLFAGAGLDDGHDITDSFGTVAYNGTAADGRPDYYTAPTSGAGVNFQDSSLTTGSGNITALGSGGNTTWYQIGVRLFNSDIVTSSGNTTLIGLGGNDVGATQEHFWGVSLEGSSITATTTGSVTLNGTGGTSLENNRGVFTDSSTIAVVSGAVNITGKGGTGGNANHGVGLSNTNITSTGTSAITIKGQSGNPAAYGLYLLNSTNIGGASATGDQTYIGNTANLDFDARTTGSVLFKPLTASSNIGLGGGSGDFLITDGQLGKIIAGTLIIGDSALGTGDFDIDTWDLSAKTHNVQLHGKNFDIGGLTTGAGSVTAYAKGGAITLSANSTSNAVGNLNLLSTHNIDINGAITNAGAGQINMFAGWDGTSAITTPALFNRDDVDLGMTARDITLGVGGSVSSAGAGTSVLLAATKKFVNGSAAGVNAVSAAGGRFLIYSENPTDTVKGGMTAGNEYSKGYNANPAASITGVLSRFVFTTADPTPPASTDSGTTSTAAGNIINQAVMMSDIPITVSFTSNTLNMVDANGDETEQPGDDVVLSSEKKHVKDGCLLSAGAGGCIIQ